MTKKTIIQFVSQRSIQRKPYLIMTIFLGVILMACNMKNGQRENQTSYLDNRESLKLEQKNIQNFFNQQGLEITVEQTKNIAPYRIFLHDFTATENQIRQIIEILELDSVTQKEFDEIHSDEFSNADYNIYSSIGKNYLKDSITWFYKGEGNNKKAQTELKVSKVYLYYNLKTKKRAFRYITDGDKI